MSKYVDLSGGMASDIVSVTPSDTVDIDGFAVGLYITGGGNISFETANGTRTLTVPDFHTFPCVITRVNATGATATGIHAYLI